MNWNPKWPWQKEIRANTWQEGSEERIINIQHGEEWVCHRGWEVLLFIFKHESAAQCYYFKYQQDRESTNKNKTCKYPEETDPVDIG